MLGSALGCSGEEGDAIADVGQEVKLDRGPAAVEIGEQASDLEDEGAASTGVEEVDPAADPTYIVYLLPLPGSRLYADVQGFLLAHPSQATSLPPHVSVTGFFESSLSAAAAASLFRRVVISVGTPFGPSPKITSVHCKSVATKSTTGVVHNWLVDLHVAVTGKRWETFRTTVITAFGVPVAKRRDVKNYHITLYEAPKASVSKSTFKSVCAAAKTAFKTNVKNDVYDNARWGVALFEQAGAGVVQVPDTGFQVAP